MKNSKKKRKKKAAAETKVVRSAPYEIEQLVRMLPDVGDRLLKTPSALDTDNHNNINPKPCVVIEVNPLACWYRVRFEDSGYCECFKVPEV